MRVIHIIPSLEKGGAERLVIDICHALGAIAGVEVALVVLSDKVAYPVKGKNFTLLTTNASVQLSVWRKNKFFIADLVRFIEAFKPDIIHSHLFEAEIVSRSVDYKQAVYFSHLHSRTPQYRRFGLQTLLRKEVFTEFYERCYLIKRYRYLGGNRFIAIAKSTSNYVKETMPADLQQVYLLANAIDVDRFRRKTPVAPGGNRLRLVNIGRLVPNKNQQFLIEVVRELHQQGYAVTLDLLGDGPDRQVLERKTAGYGLEEYIRFHGNVERVEEVLWTCDVYVHSAFSEAFGLVFPEAMAAGLPVVTSDGGGNRDIIKNGFNGFILDAAVVNDFAEKVKWLITNNEAYNTIRHNAMEDAGKYDITAYAQKLFSIYKEATV